MSTVHFLLSCEVLTENTKSWPTVQLSVAKSGNTRWQYRYSEHWYLSIHTFTATSWTAMMNESCTVGQLGIVLSMQSKRCHVTWSKVHSKVWNWWSIPMKQIRYLTIWNCTKWEPYKHFDVSVKCWYLIFDRSKCTNWNIVVLFGGGNSLDRSLFGRGDACK